MEGERPEIVKTISWSIADMHHRETGRWVPQAEFIHEAERIITDLENEGYKIGLAVKPEATR